MLAREVHFQKFHILNSGGIGKGKVKVMAYCKNCGTQIDDKAVICPNCGVPQTPQGTDNGGFLWGLLGCCIPIVGLVLFLVWKDTKPKTAKAAGIGALVWLCCVVLYYLLIIVGGVGFALMGS